MRIAFFAIISSTAALLACGTVPNVGGSETESGTDSDASTSSGTTESNPTTGPVTPKCVPGMSIACTCTNGDKGAQVCNDQGTAYFPCECEGSSNSGNEATSDEPGTSGPSTTSTTTVVDPTSDPETTSEGTTDP
ncbi:MAG TPA: hypothetical protein VIK91_18960, partial [Nannocystis sp.]